MSSSARPSQRAAQTMPQALQVCNPAMGQPRKVPPIYAPPSASWDCNCLAVSPECSGTPARRSPCA